MPRATLSLRAMDVPAEDGEEVSMQFLLIDIAAVFAGLIGFWVAAALTDAVRERALFTRRVRGGSEAHSR